MLSDTEHVWDRVIVIPACDELEQLPLCLHSLALRNHNAILILVLNAREDAPGRVHQHNQQLFEWLRSHPHRQLDPDRWYVQLRGLDIWLIDRFSAGRRFAAKQGVGLARSIGAEYAMTLYKTGRLTYPWLWCSDADVRFPAGYFDPFPFNEGAALSPYTHQPAPEELQRYEISMRYYVLGLHWAGSPYAYSTIGSTIAIHLETYRSVRGFPHREAGEDFYLLSKVAKTAPVVLLKRPPLMIAGRDSDRVPFGTGPAMRKIRAQQQALPLYHPEIFIRLRQWIQTLNSASEETLVEQLSAQAPGFPPLQKLPKLLRQRVKGQRVWRRRHEWFDAFKTLKWIHYLRDESLGTLPFDEAIAQATFIDAQSRELTALVSAMRQQEEQQISLKGLIHLNRS